MEEKGGLAAPHQGSGQFDLGKALFRIRSTDRLLLLTGVGVLGVLVALTGWLGRHEGGMKFMVLGVPMAIALPVGLVLLALDKRCVTVFHEYGLHQKWPGRETVIPYVEVAGMTYTVTINRNVGGTGGTQRSLSLLLYDGSRLSFPMGQVVPFAIDRAVGAISRAVAADLDAQLTAEQPVHWCGMQITPSGLVLENGDHVAWKELVVGMGDGRTLNMYFRGRTVTVSANSPNFGPGHELIARRMKAARGLPVE
jgi:hypothetical protein